MKQDEAGINAKEFLSAPAPDDNSNTEKRLFIQYNGLEYSGELVFEAALSDYRRKSGEKSEIKKISLYVKPQEGKAYYVIDDDPDKKGFIDL